MASMNYLTKLGVKRIVESGKKEINESTYIMQILEVKTFEHDEKKKSIKMRLKLSDGIATVTALVNSNAYEGVKNLDFKVNSIISISGFKVNKVKDKNIIILEKPFKLLGYCSTLGEPKPYEKLQPSEFTKSYDLCFQKQKENINENSTSAQKEEEIMANAQKKQFTENKAPPVQMPKTAKKGGGFVEIKANESMDHEYTPIAALNPMNPDWIIKARVTKKGAPRHWKNFRGEGDLMNIELKDEHGDQIQATFFNKYVDRFKDQIQEGKVYAFQNGQVKAANSRYTAIKNEYAITFGKDTVITLIGKLYLSVNMQIVKLYSNFVTLSLSHE